MEKENQLSVLVDFVIAVHTPDRPIQRAILSLINGGLPTEPSAKNRLRVTIVCHNTSVDGIRARVDPDLRRIVRFVEYNDGIGSPAGPFNRGLSLATGQWVGIMGSDDSLEENALLHWVEAAQRENADVLIAPMKHASGGPIRTPVARPRRTAKLDPILDRLSYRTAPLGLMKRALIADLGLTFPTKYATGEDQSFSAELWFSGANISYGRRLPKYVVHDDAQQRVTATPRPIAEDLAFATDLVGTDWFQGRSERERAAIVTKLIRVHVFAHVGLRVLAGTWQARDAADMAKVLETLLLAAPRAIRPLSLADRSLVDAITRSEGSLATMKALTVRRRTFSDPRTWLPRDFAAMFHPEAPLRFMSASSHIT